MHNQVKLQARNGMALLKTEKANSRDIPSWLLCLLFLCWQERRSKIFKCADGKLLRTMAWATGLLIFPAFFRNQYNCLEQKGGCRVPGFIFCFSPFCISWQTRGIIKCFGCLERIYMRYSYATSSTPKAGTWFPKYRRSFGWWVSVSFFLSEGENLLKDLMILDKNFFELEYSWVYCFASF